MQDRVEEQIKVQIQGQIVDRKDLAAVWAVGILISLLLSLIGLSWTPDQYEAIRSNSVDPTEAQIEESQNKMVADALNDGKIEYHSSMEKLVKLRPLYQRAPLDLFRILLFPTAPIVMIGLLIRKTVRQAKEPG